MLSKLLEDAYKNIDTTTEPPKNIGKWLQKRIKSGLLDELST